MALAVAAKPYGKLLVRHYARPTSLPRLHRSQEVAVLAALLRSRGVGLDESAGEEEYESE